MWLYRKNENGGREPADDESSSDPAEEQRLDRYRSYGRFYERYWARIFSLTQADLSAIADLMRASGEAYDVTTLARRIIQSRLRRGPELSSGPASDGLLPTHQVRPWDSHSAWRAGDRTIVIVPLPRPDRAYAPRVGEISYVEDDHVVVHVDGLSAPQVYPAGHVGGHASADASDGFREGIDSHLALESKMAMLADAEEEELRIDYILWRYGHYVVGRLLHALETDDLFVELEGLWFLTELADRPDAEALTNLARQMFNGPGEPMSMDELVPLLGAPMGDVAARFGLLVAMREQTELFEEVGSSSRPRWLLRCPPPMQMLATNAVYDPETYEVLCRPGDMLSSPVVQRLWDLDLLQAAIGTAQPEAAPSPAANASTAPGERPPDAGSSPTTSPSDSAGAPRSPRVRYSRRRWGRGPRPQSPADG
ncbi:MAG: hypothetical protein ACP5JG_13380 [Anaerolineae bacterium]